MKSKDNSRWNPYIGLVKGKSDEENSEDNRWESYVAQRSKSKDKSLSKSWTHINNLVKSIRQHKNKRDTFIKIID